MYGLPYDLNGDGDMDGIEHRNGLVWFEARLLGDVNRDGRFDSSDLVSAFQAGTYEQNVLAAAHPVPEPSGIASLVIVMFAIRRRRRDR